MRYLKLSGKDQIKRLFSSKAIHKVGFGESQPICNSVADRILDIDYDHLNYFTQGNNYDFVIDTKIINVSLHGRRLEFFNKQTEERSVYKGIKEPGRIYLLTVTNKLVGIIKERHG